MADTKPEQTERPKYRAFISYSHADKAIATWLHNTLERYHIPKKLIGKSTSLGKVPAKLTPIFRDQDELPASGNLGAELQNALANSLHLIVICSTASAQSKWVNEEIRQFKALHGSDRLLALVVDGKPNSNDATTECFAPALKFEVDEKGKLSYKPCEPIAADMRKQADGKRLASLKLISGLTGLKLDDLVQRDAARRTRTLMQISIASITAAVFALGLAIYANNQRLEANAQRQIAEQESETARAVSDFLVDSFASANSAQYNPSEVTARSILDRGSNRVLTELKGQPLIQSRLSATIGLAFNNLGLFNEAINIVDATKVLTSIELPEALIVKAEAFLKKGDLNAALITSQTIESLLKQSETLGNSLSKKYKLQADLSRIRAIVYTQRGQHNIALEAFENAMEALAKMTPPPDIVITNLLQNRALLFSDIGDFESAKLDLAKAIATLESSASDKHIYISTIALTQAQVNFLSGDLEPAKERINFALKSMKEILDDDNPFVADAYSMKGQILHALGELEEADAALTRAVTVYDQAYGGRHYLSGIAEVYLGLISGDRKDLPTALAHFEQAKLHYDESYGQIHPNHGDLLVNQALVLASMGETTRALQDCSDGMDILNDTLGKEAAFTQQLQAACDAIVPRL